MTSIRHTAFFGDRDHSFALTDPMVRELEQITGRGIGALYLETVAGRWHLPHLTEIVRLGLIGGGMNPEQALRLVNTYAKDRPLAEVYPLALDVLDARWSGVPDTQPNSQGTERG